MHQTIARYNNTSHIGTGSTGTVYRAEHAEQPGPAVALKLLHQTVAAQAADAEGFDSTLRNLAALQHTALLPVLAYGTDQDSGQGYLVLEHAQAGSLRDLIALQQPLPLAQALDLICQAAAGVAYVQQWGTHQNIKPENLLLQPAAPDNTQPAFVLKVADFGLSTFQQPFEPGANPAIQQSRHRTLLYAAPEHFEDAPLDASSDVFALGAVLFELLTGQPPFPADPAAALEARRAETVPSVLALRPDLPGAVDVLLSHCLAATSALRLPTAADLLQALLGVAESLGIAVGSVVPLTGSDTTAPSQPMLLIQERDVEPRSIVLPGNNLVIGRDANCDIVLQSKRVSRRHLRLEWDGQQCFLTDLDSANGTFLDGADLPINKPVVWPSQAAVRVGHVEIRLQLPETDE